MMCRHVEVLCKQDASYESRISDWSSGVCSSDLGAIIIKPRLRIETPIWKPIGEHRNCGRRQRLVDLARTAQQFAEELIEPARHQLPSGRSEEHTSELQSLMRISYAVFCLKKKNTNKIQTLTTNTSYNDSPKLTIK